MSYEVRSDKVNKSNGWSLFLFFMVYGLTMLVGGYFIGEPAGYHEGIKDGVRSTLLIEPDNECTVLKHNRGDWK